MPMKIITSIRRFRPADAVVVVDVFRSSATICYGLRNGITELRVVDKLKEVFAIAEKNDLKIGEKRGMKPAGFDFSNSPTEMLSEKVRGRRAVFSSTNLAHILNSNGPRENVFIGTFCNAYSLAKHLKKFLSVNFVACSSPEWDFYFRFEDLVGIGKILFELKKFEKLEMNFLSKVCLWIYENFRAKSLLLSPTTYGTALVAGWGDIKLCSKENNLSVVPACEYERNFVGVKSI